jgi:hypothetical protein
LQVVTDKDWLRQAGYINTNKPLAVKFERDSPAVAKVVIDPATVVYPQSQIHDRALSTQDNSTPLRTTFWSRGRVGESSSLGSCEKFTHRSAERVLRP